MSRFKIFFYIFFIVFFFFQKSLLAENDQLKSNFSSQLVSLEIELKNIKNQLNPNDENAFYFIVIDLLNEIFNIQENTSALDPIINEAPESIEETEDSFIQGEETFQSENYDTSNEIISPEEFNNDLKQETNYLSTKNFFLYIFLAATVILSVFFIIKFAQRKSLDPRRNSRIKINTDNEPTIIEEVDILSSKDTKSENKNQSREIKTYGQSLINDESDFKGEIGFTIFTEKKVKKGEDSKPILSSISNLETFLSVCDGLGGAGAAEITAASGQKNTGAYFGANILYDFLVEKCNEKKSSLFEDPDQLKNEIKILFESESENFEFTSTGIISKKPSKLPTTFAGMKITNSEKNILSVISLWAGDSRNYAITLENGLQMCSIDDVKDQDPIELLTSDSPMNNYINAEGKFSINFKKLEFNKPVIFLTATDGCFSYFSSPMYFEFIILKALEESKNVDGWKKKLQEEIQSVTQDDATLSLCTFGWDSYQNLQQTFSGKSQLIYDQYIKPSKDSIDELDRLKEQLKTHEDLHKKNIKTGISNYIKNRIKN